MFGFILATLLNIIIGNLPAITSLFLRPSPNSTIRLACNRAYVLIQRESVINSRGQCYQVPLRHSDSYPAVVFLPHVKVCCAFQNVADLVVQVQMFFIEHFQLKEGRRKEDEIQNAHSCS